MKRVGPRKHLVDKRRRELWELRYRHMHTGDVAVAG